VIDALSACTLTLAFNSHLRRNKSQPAEPTDAPMNDEIKSSCSKSIEVGSERDARTIAVQMRSGGSPGLFWLSGFKSDMNGTKAQALDAWAAANGRSCVRFDYSGHGLSGAEFRDGTIGRWLEESYHVFEASCRGPQVIIGSSMGGWLALLLVREWRRRKRLADDASIVGLVLIAPALDFT
jgi:pimeloyl-ACP methyl ester carboxylesterase